MDNSNVLNIISIIISFLGLFGFGSIILYKMKRSDEIKDRKIIERQKEQDSKVTEITTEVIRNELIPIKNSLDELKNDNALNKKGLQAVLRDRLYELFKYVTEYRCKGDISKAYATLDEKQNFENMYQNYHSLGVNGVMDAKYETFMHLPDYPSIEPKVKRTTKKKKGE